jgi:hypothetical protein
LFRYVTGAEKISIKSDVVLPGSAPLAHSPLAKNPGTTALCLLRSKEDIDERIGDFFGTGKSPIS